MLHTQKTAAALLEILHKIHDAGVCHSDPYPRNMVVQPETDRVLWIDLDRAQTVSDGSITNRQGSWMEEDTDLRATRPSGKEPGLLP